MSELVEIHVDVHEMESEVFDAIAARDIGAVIKRSLKAGDVVLRYRGKTVSLEIKRNQDFTKSLKENRLHLQICKMYDNYDFPMLIVEDWHPWVGDEDDKESIKEKVRLHEKTIKTLNRRITTEETKHLSETVDLIEDIVRDMLNGKLFVMRRPIQVESGLSDSMKVICSLPNVKEILGERILDKYGTVEKALADVDNWTEIQGIGEQKLTRIKNTLEDEVYGE